MKDEDLRQQVVNELRSDPAVGDEKISVAVAVPGSTQKRPRQLILVLIIDFIPAAESALTKYPRTTGWSLRFCSPAQLRCIPRSAL